MAKSKHGREERAAERKKRVLEKKAVPQEEAHRDNAATVSNTADHPVKKRKTDKGSKKKQKKEKKASFFEMAKANADAHDVDLASLEAEIEANQVKVAERVATTAIVDAPVQPKTLQAKELPRMNRGTIFHRKVTGACKY